MKRCRSTDCFDTDGRSLSGEASSRISNSLKYAPTFLFVMVSEKNFSYAFSHVGLNVAAAEFNTEEDESLSSSDNL